MRIALVLVAGILSLVIPRIGSAQGPASSILWQKPALLPEGPVLALGFLEAQAPDHRWEGMAIGAGVGALAFGLLGAVVCSQSDATSDCTGLVLGVGLLGAFCGGVTGGLIGGAIPKGEPADSTGEST